MTDDNQMMTAARIARYGGPEQVQLVRRPCPRPRPDEVLVRVRAAPVTSGDARIRALKVPRGFTLPLRLAMGWSRPRAAPGWAFAGEVGDPGPTGLPPGARVFGICGLRGGAHADWLAVPAARLLPLPEGLSFAEGAAFFFGGLTAADYLIDRAALQPGERVLINGATGAVGSAAIQIARHVGAQVCAVASARNHALARQLGAAEVADYRDGLPGGQWDVILDVIGTMTWAEARPRLAPGGRLALISADLAATLGAVLWPRREGRRLLTGPTGESAGAMRRLVSLFRDGAYRPVVGATLPFADLAQAHALAETFHKPGNLVVTMADSGRTLPPEQPPQPGE